MLYIFIFLAILFAIAILLSKNSGKTDAIAMPVTRRPLLTLNEACFFRELTKIVPAGRYVSCKCRLEDVMKVPENIPNRNQYRNKIKSRHVDFVVFDPLSGQIDYAIELDDQTHNTPSRYKDDQLKNVAFSNAGIPLVRMKAKRNYSCLEIAADLNKYFGLQ